MSLKLIKPITAAMKEIKNSAVKALKSATAKPDRNSSTITIGTVCVMAAL
ncbi:MAG: hypothetical protein LE169_05275 [Endomicrobium sp.]|nr:hypothetical protein [Endomicrobium sp.]